MTDSTRPRIGYVVPNSPLPVDSGHRLRLELLWRGLSALGEVRMIALGPVVAPAARREIAARGGLLLPPRIEHGAGKILRHVGALARGQSMMLAKHLSRRRVARIRADLDAFGADLVVLGDTSLTPLIDALRRPGRRIIVDTHNVETRLYRRIVQQTRGRTRLKNMLFLLNMHQLERHLRKADAVWACSANDLAIYRRSLKSLHLVRNVLDLSGYDPLQAETSDPTIGYCGSFGYPPNADAAHRLLALSTALLNRGVAHRLLLIGRDPDPALIAEAAQLPHVTVTGAVPDVKPLLGQVWVVGAPLHAGSGTKFKLLEAMALGRPIVTTPVGAEGLGLANGQNGYITETDADMLDRFADLLANRPLRTQVGAAGRHLVEADFSFDRLVADLRAAIQPA